MLDRSFRIRLADPRDAHGCAFLQHTSWMETYSDVLPASHWEADTLERRTRDWEQSLSDGRSVTVAEIAGMVIGIARSNPARQLQGYEPVRELELASIYVIAAYHGTGPGQALFDTVVPAGTPAQLWVVENNLRARRFYERNGFIADGTRVVDDQLGIAQVRHVR